MKFKVANRAILLPAIPFLFIAIFIGSASLPGSRNFNYQEFCLEFTNLPKPVLNSSGTRITPPLMDYSHSYGFLTRKECLPYKFAARETNNREFIDLRNLISRMIATNDTTLRIEVLIPDTASYKGIIQLISLFSEYRTRYVFLSDENKFMVWKESEFEKSALREFNVRF